jgi:DNA modification methylase
MAIDQVLQQDSLPFLVSLADQSIDVVMTDPPYPNGKGLFADTIIDGIAGLYLCAKKAKRHVIFFWTPLVEPPLPPPGWFVSNIYIWDKPDCKTSIRYERIVVWSRDYTRHGYKVWRVPIVEFKTLKDFSARHPTQKAVRLMRYLIEDFSQPGDLILDPFAGTGTTGVAAKQAGRHYILSERHEEYAQIARERLMPPAQPTNPSPPATEEPTPKPKKNRSTT